MIESLSSVLIAHLWQSTLVVGVVWLMTLALRGNRRTRALLAMDGGLGEVSRAVLVARVARCAVRMAHGPEQSHSPRRRSSWRRFWRLP